VFYHPSAYAIGFRDVISAWLICLVVAVTGLAGAAIAEIPENHDDTVAGVPQSAGAQAARSSPLGCRPS
jgi:hypothetical protein